MSRVGNSPIAIPGGVSVKIDDAVVTVTGPKGELTLKKAAVIEARVEDGQVLVSRNSDEKPVRALHGTTRSLIANMVEGVSKGYTKELEIQGVGFRAQMQGRRLVMSLGHSHPIEYEVPDGITVDVPAPTNIVVSGVGKQLVGQVSARIRAFAPAEPYKGKGVRYKGEEVRRKAGKTIA